jgi:hypothetical protein
VAYADQWPGTAYLKIAVREVFESALCPVAPSRGPPRNVAGIQTFGPLINFHPHIHAIATDGVNEKHLKEEELESSHTSTIQTEIVA